MNRAAEILAIVVNCDVVTFGPSIELNLHTQRYQRTTSQPWIALGRYDWDAFNTRYEARVFCEGYARTVPELSPIIVELGLFS